MMANGKLCWWSLDESQSGRIVTTQANGDSKTQAEMRRVQQPYRICKPITQTDSDGNAYDLTRQLIEQIMFYPYAPLKDLIDATSRIYDMDARPPVIIDERDLEPECFED